MGRLCVRRRIRCRYSRILTMNGTFIPSSLSILAWGIDLEYTTGWKAAGAFLLLSIPIVVLGLRSLTGLGPVRKWAAIAFRLLVLLVIVLLLSGARWNRTHKTLDLIVIRDISKSTNQYRNFPAANKNLTDAIDDYLKIAADD